MTPETRKTVRIGAASGFWGDSILALPQLLEEGGLDYIVFDYLAELTMSILAAARAKKPELGYATDFVRIVGENLTEIAESGVRLIANAGGMNPRGCAAALRAAAGEQGVELKIAFVEGDDVIATSAEGHGNVDEASLDEPPTKFLTANAYLGALPIKAALDAGAQIVITGRCVDSAVTLGALMHEFDWATTDYDKLAQGSIAGHLVECGCQGTGGLYTDWQEVPDWENMGYPVLECEADGSFVITKPNGTGGLVTPATVGEQVLYEVGDPRRYLLPDVICDFSNIVLEQDGEHRVRVTGVRGMAPGNSYKVSATYADGFKAVAQLTIIGSQAAQKAQRVADAILARATAISRARGYADFQETLTEVLGAESAFGPHSTALAAREVVLRISVRHVDRAALELFAGEVAPAATSFCQGITGVGGRARPTPVIKQSSFLLEKDKVRPRIVLEDREFAVVIPVAPVSDLRPDDRPRSFDLPADRDPFEVPLIRIAHGRSGDKGDSANIGIIARTPELLPYVVREVTADRVKDWVSHLVKGEVTRFDVPGLNAVNFLCEKALGGGGMASLRNDPLGKGFAQMLLEMPVTVPRALVPSEVN